MSNFVSNFKISHAISGGHSEYRKYSLEAQIMINRVAMAGTAEEARDYGAYSVKVFMSKHTTKRN